MRWYVYLCLTVVTGCVDLRQPASHDTSSAADGAAAGTGDAPVARDAPTADAAAPQPDGAVDTGGPSGPDAAADLAPVAKNDAFATDAPPMKTDAAPMLDVAPACVVSQCGGYQCGSGGCLTSCASDRDCVEPLLCGAGACGGLRAEIYSDNTFSQRHSVRIDPRVDFDWGLEGPLPGLNEFAVRWTGTVTARHSERYTFWINSDDGARLWVENVQLIDRWMDGAHSDLKGGLNLQAGVPTRIVLEFYDSGFWGNVKLFWSSPSQAKEIVPTSALRPAP